MQHLLFETLYLFSFRSHYPLPFSFYHLLNGHHRVIALARSWSVQKPEGGMHHICIEVPIIIVSECNTWPIYRWTIFKQPWKTCKGRLDPSLQNPRFTGNRRNLFNTEDNKPSCDVPFKAPIKPQDQGYLCQIDQNCIQTQSWFTDDHAARLNAVENRKIVCFFEAVPRSV